MAVFLYEMWFIFYIYMNLEVQYKCIYLTSCIQNFGPIIYYCDQLSFTATMFPESMLPVWQKLIRVT